MTVSTADSGPAALATLRAAAAEGRPFAVALLDRSMPGMDGLDAEGRHRRRSGALAPAGADDRAAVRSATS